MTGRRIEFPSDDAARFNALRDQWRGAAASLPLSASARRVAIVLPNYVSREFGYAFPTDDDLRGDLKASKETVKRGLADLEKADLIERETRIKRDENREAIGRERRVFLTLPGLPIATPQKPKGEGSGRLLTSEETVRGEGSVPLKVKGQEVKGQPEVKGQKRVGEGSYGGPNIPDSYTPDFQIRSGDRKVSVYEKAVPSVEAVPSADLPKHRKVDAPSLPRNPYPTPRSWGTDEAFLAAFDRRISAAVGQGIAAGQIERITAEAFNGATRETGDMPVYWPEILALRDPSIAEWFRFRASTILHRREAA